MGREDVVDRVDRCRDAPIRRVNSDTRGFPIFIAEFGPSWAVGFGKASVEVYEGSNALNSGHISARS